MAIQPRTGAAWVTDAPAGRRDRAPRGSHSHGSPQSRRRMPRPKPDVQQRDAEEKRQNPFDVSCESSRSTAAWPRTRPTPHAIVVPSRNPLRKAMPFVRGRRIRMTTKSPSARESWLPRRERRTGRDRQPGSRVVPVTDLHAMPPALGHRDRGQGRIVGPYVRGVGVAGTLTFCAWNRAGSFSSTAFFGPHRVPRCRTAPSTVRPNLEGRPPLRRRDRLVRHVRGEYLFLSGLTRERDDNRAD
jgi:hypothetical protein